MANRANMGWLLANMKDHEHLVAGTTGGVGPSPAIWSDCPLLSIMLNPQKGFVYFDDFFNGFTDLAAAGWGNNLYLYEQDAGFLKHDPAVPGGIVKLGSDDTTADDGATVRIPGCQIYPDADVDIYFECRAATLNGGGQMFIGLCDDSENTPVDSGDAITADKDLCGFFRDAGTADTKWSVGVCDGDSSEEADDKATADEGTYDNYGMIVRGIGNVAGARVEFYFNGACVYVADDYTDIPDGVMCPVFQAHADGTDKGGIALDWLRIAVHDKKDGTVARETVYTS